MAARKTATRKSAASATRTTSGMRKPRSKTAPKSKTTSRKPKTTTAPKKSTVGAARGHVATLERYQRQGAIIDEQLNAGKSWDQIAKHKDLQESKGPATVSRLRRIHVAHKLAPKDRLYTKGMTEDEMATEIAKLRDEQDLPWFPDIWARTFMSPSRMKSLYEKGSGKSWKESGKPKAAKAKAPAGRKKAAAPRGAGAKSKATLAAIADAEGMSAEDAEAALVNRKLTVVRGTLTEEYEVKSVRSFKKKGTERTAVSFIDVDQKVRDVRLSEVTRIR